MTTRYVQVGQCTTDTDTVHTVSHQRYIHDSTGGEAPSLLHWQSQLHWRDPLPTPLAGPPSRLHWQDPLGQSTTKCQTSSPEQNFSQSVQQLQRRYVPNRQTADTHTNTSTTYPAICPVEGDLVAMNTSLISTSAFQYHTTQPKTHQQGQDQDSNCQHQDSDFASL